MKKITNPSVFSLSGQLLIAMPSIKDHNFEQSVIYICWHDKNGAMGIIINKVIESLYLSDILSQINISYKQQNNNLPVYFGGPVEIGKGFVLHTTDYTDNNSIKINNNIALTANIDILKNITSSNTPKKKLLALGYTGWSAGQLENELKTNSWLQVEADDNLIFDTNSDNRWEKTINKLGIKSDMLFHEIGHA